MPLKGYDISFLITDKHLEKYEKYEMIGFIIEVIFSYFTLIFVSYC